MRDDKPSIAHQENYLALLCFSKEHALTVRSMLDPDLFSGDWYKDIAREATFFLDRFNSPIGDHLPDVFDRILSNKDEHAKRFEAILHGLKGLSANVNIEYTLSTLRKFASQQRLKAGVIAASQALQNEDLDQAYDALSAAMRNQIEVFDPGFIFGEDSIEKLAGLIDDGPEFISTGIPHLDDYNIGPTRQELLIVLAPTNRGKSWALVQIAKAAAMARNRVLIITLEMSESRYSQRVMQNVFSISRKPIENATLARIHKDDFGRFKSIERKPIPNKKKRLSFHKDDRDDVLKLIDSRWGYLKKRFDIIVKGFPTNQLTMQGLRAYLDQLENSRQWMPDVIIVDYPDLMAVNVDRLRLDLSTIYKDLRGLAQERNIAVVGASQSNRQGENARYVDLQHLGEDYTKAQTADMIISYNRTKAEYKLGTARIFVAKARNEQAHATIVVSQAYEYGQFYIDSALLTDRYWVSVDDFWGDGKGTKEVVK